MDFSSYLYVMCLIICRRLRANVRCPLSYLHLNKGIPLGTCSLPMAMQSTMYVAKLDLLLKKVRLQFLSWSFGQWPPSLDIKSNTAGESEPTYSSKHTSSQTYGRYETAIFLEALRGSPRNLKGRGIGNEKKTGETMEITREVRKHDFHK